MKMFNIILKDTFYKIHLYFYGNKIYFYFIDLIWWKGNNTFSIITKVHLYLNRLFNNNKLNSSEDNFSSRLLIYLEKKIKINNKLNIILNLLFKYSGVEYCLVHMEECFYYYFLIRITNLKTRPATALQLKK